MIDDVLRNPRSPTAYNSTNHDTRFMIEMVRLRSPQDYSARSISLAAGNGLLKGGSLNGVVCAHVSRNAEQSFIH